MAKGVLVSGCTGKMGKNIINLLTSDAELSYEYGFSTTSNPPKEINDLALIDASKVDVVVDFSLPQAFRAVLEWGVNNKKPFLSGTTGLSEAEMKLLKQASKTIPVLLSANTSLGINLVHQLIPHLSPIKHFDIQMVEAHHKQKLDAPSGTAIYLQDQLKECLTPDIPEPLAIRGGGIFGEHEIHFMSDEEVITIKHTALNRNVFAKGAIYLAKWLLNKPAGFYTMSDVFKPEKL